MQRQTKNNDTLKLLCECIEVDAGSDPGIEDEYKNGFVTLSEVPSTIVQYAFKPITATSAEFDTDALEWIDFSFDGSRSVHLVLAAKIGSNWLTDNVDPDGDNEIEHEVTLVRDLTLSLERKQHIKEYNSDIDSETEDTRVQLRKTKKKDADDEAELARLKRVQAELSDTLDRLNAERAERAKATRVSTPVKDDPPPTANDKGDSQPTRPEATSQNQSTQDDAKTDKPDSRTEKTPYYTHPQYQNDRYRGRRNQNRRGSYRNQNRAIYQQYDYRDNYSSDRRDLRQYRPARDSRSSSRDSNCRPRSRSPRRRSQETRRTVKSNATSTTATIPSQMALSTAPTAAPVGWPPAQTSSHAQTIANFPNFGPYIPQPPQWSTWNQPPPNWNGGWGGFNLNHNNWALPAYNQTMPQQWQNNPQQWSQPPNTFNVAAAGPPQPTRNGANTANIGSSCIDTNVTRQQSQQPPPSQPNTVAISFSENPGNQSTLTTDPATQNNGGANSLPQRTHFQQMAVQRNPSQGPALLQLPTGPPPPMCAQNSMAVAPSDTHQQGVAINAYQAAWQHYYNGANPPQQQQQQQPVNGEAQ